MKQSLRTLGLVFGIVAMSSVALAHDAAHDQRLLPYIGPAPEFALKSQDGVEVKLRDFRGKAVALTFIFASCTDTCPMLTDKMARVQDKLGADFGSKIVFISITVDPLRDTPQVLKDYANAYGANLNGWLFLTGDSDSISEVERRYGVFVERTSSGDINHTFLTSLIDPDGLLRVQYLGVRFDIEEFRRDLLSLVK
ncbi:MAG TPA: SCO family protein [Aestuariivirgaceae bacterium]